MSFFSASKLIWPFLQPSNLMIISMLFFLVLLCCQSNTLRRIGRYGALIFSLLFVFLMVIPVGYWSMSRWERRVEAPSLPADIDGIIVLGGGLNHFFPSTQNHSYIQDNADRYMVMLQLMKRYPTAKILYTGGSGELFQQQSREGDIIKNYTKSLGLTSDRIMIESDSQNTYQNAAASKALVMPKKEEKWLLVTSAYHMPRAKAVFDRVEWQVMPYPVDYRVPPWQQERLLCLLCYRQNISYLDLVAREMVGILAYRLTGKI